MQLFQINFGKYAKNKRCLKIKVNFDAICFIFILKHCVWVMFFSEQDQLYKIPDPVEKNRRQGENGRNLMVVLYDDGPEARSFIEKVLSAAQVDLLRDTAFFTLPPGEPMALQAALKSVNAETVLLFGPSADQLGLGINTRLYAPFEWQSRRWLFAEAPALLEPDRTRKGLLWKALQQMFLSV